jgi:hypothetical protein
MANFHSRRPLVGRIRGRAGRLFVGLSGGIAAVLALGATAFAGPIRGSVTVPPDAQPMQRAPSTPDHYWRVWNGVLEPLPEQLDPSRELAVVLTGTVAGEPIGCSHALRGGALSPSTLVVRTESTLRIENYDGCSHSLVAEGIEVFQPLETPPGNARAVPVGEGGPWVIRDVAHPHVEGHLHAVPDLVACGTVDSRGGYTFPALPAGSYTLKVFRGDAEVGSVPLEVPEYRELNVPAIELTPSATR